MEEMKHWRTYHAGLVVPVVRAKHVLRVHPVPCDIQQAVVQRPAERGPVQNAEVFGYCPRRKKKINKMVEKTNTLAGKKKMVQKTHKHVR